jgi:hypothetical protein
VSIPPAPGTWPPLPTEPDQSKAEFAKALYEAQVADYAARLRDPILAAVVARALEASRQDAAVAADDALRKDIQSAYIAVMQGSLDRSVRRAEFLNTASAAIATAYSSLLGLLFVAKDHPLQAWAVAPVVFLALAFVFGLIYVSFINRKTDERQLIPSGIGGRLAEKRLEDFLEWVSLGVLRRAWALRASVVSVAVGVALLPLPFVSLNDSYKADAVALGAIGLLIGVFVIPFAVWAYRKVLNRPEPKGVALPLFR